MKKIISLLLVAITISVSISAQTVYPGVPLFGTQTNQDRTYRVLQIGTTTIADTLGSTIDTLTLIPGFVSLAGAVYNEEYVLNLKDSCVLAIRDVSSSYTYSTMTIIINAPSFGGKVKFLGYSGLPTSQWDLASAATSVSPTGSHPLVINFKCSGTAWIETSRSQD